MYSTPRTQLSLFYVQSNLGITTTEGTGSKWSYFSGGLTCQVWFKNFQYEVVHMPLREPWHHISYWWLPRVRGGVNNDHTKAELADAMIARSECLRRKSWTINKVFFAQFYVLVCGRFSQVGISQVVALSRTHSVHLNLRIEGTEIVCPQFSGGRFCQVVARTGSTVFE